MTRIQSSAQANVSHTADCAVVQPQIDAHCSNALEDPWVEPKESMFTRSVSPEKAPDKPTYIEMEFERVHSLWV